MSDVVSEDAQPDAEAPDEAAPAVINPAALGIELPDDPAEAQQLLLRNLLVAKNESAEYFETMQRVAAEFDNYRKRTERDRTELVTRATQRLLTDMLPTLDSFDAAVAYEPQTPAEEKILDGMRGTRTLLLELLQGEGLEPIPTDRVRFDPAVHEAVSGPMGEGDGELVVTNELRRGYTLGGMLLRAALVTVDHGEPAADESVEDASD
ncbi:MAG: nucleotide exchange factor GrpE [Acidimicrobiia bacterium]|nr:nucleotide exchange factor GrpE [Acidimicrobiia bacterium]